MTEFLSEYQAFFIGLSILSLVFFLGSLAAVPWLVGRLPRDYFLQSRERSETKLLGALVRNGVGAVIFCMGVIMLFIPGQGVLTMVTGLIIMQFPGKSRLIRYIAGFESVRSGLNWLRLKKEKPPLDFPDRRAD